MIKIDRARLSPPDILLENGEKELLELRSFYSQGTKFQSQRKTRFNVRLLNHKELKKYVWELSYSKCAYCESPISGETTNKQDDLVVDQFRPRLGAIRENGRVDSNHYWWLAYDWDNQLPSCYTCNRSKGKRFPINGHPAKAEARGKELLKEKPVLLDPAQDFPDEHLWVEKTGQILALSGRGDSTIAILDLNRGNLVEGRKSAFKEAFNLYVAARSDPDLDEAVQQQLDGKLVYTLARRSAYEAASEIEPPRRKKTPADRSAASDVPISKLKVDEKRKESKKYSVVQSLLSTEDNVASGPAIWIQRITAHNFMGLREFELEFPKPLNPEREPWIILLGKNGSGKSSILKAVALALAKSDIRQQYFPDASFFMNRNTSERSGHVTVYFNRGEPLKLNFRKWNKEFTASREPPQINLLGYGATRLPPPIGKSTLTTPIRFRVGNLFDPWEVLSDAEDWMTNTKQVDSAQFGRLASSLRELLDLNEGDQIVRYRRRLYVKQGGARVRLRQLSDGYQSVIALAMDIMLNLAHDWSLMETAEGTVLLDEIEVHLHPQWKVSIVNSLRSLFPKLRFITSTHDPLCLNGALPGEVHVVDRDRTGMVETIQTDIPEGTRADQVLTGDWFGLSTTLDDGTINLMEEHRKMLLLPESEQDSVRREEIIRELRRRLGTYADTSVDQMALQAASQVIGEQDVRMLSQAARKQAKENILRMVREKAK